MNERELRVRLGYWLQGQRACQEPGWLEAVQEVPRHKLVPAGWCERRDGSRYRSEDVPPEEWVDTLCHDKTIVTREDEHGTPTSSSTMPSIVTLMLDFLHVQDGNEVLEIGTGAGYSTALLCHRLGSEHVTSIDNQPDLVRDASRRLAEIGYRPRLVAGHGRDGVQAGAPYDRVIGTCFTWPVPASWIEQARPGGRVVAVVPTGVVGLEVEEDGSASGYYHWGVFGFMPMLGHTLVTGKGASLPEDHERRRSWRRPPSVFGAGGETLPFTLLAHTLAAPFEYADYDHRTPAQVAEVDLCDVRDMSRARIVAGAAEVCEAGPRSLWDEVEELYDKWCALGAPARERFGLTVTPDGRHTLWLDDPESEPYWDATPRAG